MSDVASIVIEDDTWVSPTEVGRWISMTAERVRQLAADGVLRRQDGSYPLRECVLRYLAWRDADRRDASKTAADARVRDLRAEEIELRLERERGTLVKEAQQEALAVVDLYAGTVKTGIRSMIVREIKDLPLRQRLLDGADAEFGAAAQKAAAEAAGAPPPNRAARRAQARSGRG